MNPKNEASLGPLLKEDYIPKKTDSNREERLDNMLTGFSERVEKERKTVMDHDQTLYLKSTHVLKRGREYQHKGNNMIIDICHNLSIRISEIKDNLNKFKSKLNDIFKTLQVGEKIKAKRKREIDNAWKINKRRKSSKLFQTLSLFQNLGREPSDEMYRPEEGIPQITLLAYDSLVEYIPTVYTQIFESRVIDERM